MAKRDRGYIGTRRSAGTRKSVRTADAIARVFITLGGIGTIVAVSLVCVFLVSVVIPLFGTESLADPTSLTVEFDSSVEGPIHVATDEYLNIGWCAFRNGSYSVFRLDTGAILKNAFLIPEGKELTAWSFGQQGEVGLAYADGDIQLGRVSFATLFLKEREPAADDAATTAAGQDAAEAPPALGGIFAQLNDAPGADPVVEADEEVAAGGGAMFLLVDEIPDDVKSLQSREVAAYRNGMVERTPEGQLRLQELHIALDEPVTVQAGMPIRLIDRSIPGGKDEESLAARTEVLALVTDDGLLRVASVKKLFNIMLQKETLKLRKRDLQLDLGQSGALPKHLLLAGLGDNVFLAWEDGRLQRYDTRPGGDLTLAEQIDVVDGDRTLTALEFMVGKTSLISGDSQGGISVWFRTKPEGLNTVDGARLEKGHALEAGSAAVTTISASSRSRMLAAGFADGEVKLYHVTSRQMLASSKTADASALSALAISPKDDAVLGLANAQAGMWRIDAPHPETTIAAMFSPVWYEGYENADHVWQSSSGDDAFEPKYGLRPLVFGSIKATLYSMLFGAPLALLAAIYTSEFLKPSTKGRIKPTIEIMASLPSVVLGFLAALVVAPMVEDIVPESISAFVTVPFALLVGAYCWQLMSASMSIRLRILRIPLAFVAIAVGLWLASIVGPVVEDWLFEGDIKAWLDGQVGTGTGGWMFLMLPLAVFVVVLLTGMFVTPVQRRFAQTRRQFVLLDMGKFLAGCCVTVLLAWSASAALSASGFDPRGSFVDTYEQRNALVVGFIMGFAIIPIIYTISDDALSAVPETLRAGSLGAGATEWQTAVRVIIPTAMSGLFSAMMIGLGRAVGETMIVLMAAGNTPIMGWNIFNGFRTLSANIAVELPEAVRDSTHYRMLFLAALTLFALTFALNTVAEVIRLRFRKRAFQL